MKRKRKQTFATIYEATVKSCELFLARLSRRLFSWWQLLPIVWRVLVWNKDNEYKHTSTMNWHWGSEHVYLENGPARCLKQEPYGS